jgi:glycosyltransferase involved in cell wall biosynthesis
MNPRVVYWNNIPAPYMVDRFNAIARRGNLDFEAWFSARTEDGRSWTVNESAWRFRSQYLPSITVGTRPFAFPSRLFDSSVPDLLIGLHADPAFLVTQEVARRRGGRAVFWVTPTYDSWVRRRRWKERLKRSVFPRVDAIFTTGPDGKELAERYGARSDRVFMVPHFIDCGHLIAQQRRASLDRPTVRSELGIHGLTFLYVGRLWDGKGLDYLLDAFQLFANRTKLKTTLVLAGDGPAERRLRRRCVDAKLSVVFTGFHQRDQLWRIYAAADIFVFPTLGDPFGHVVEEAMSCGLPVISTSAAGEIRARISDGCDGFIVPPADSAALLERMELLARNHSLRERMAQAGAKRVAGHTADNWASEFESAVGAVLALD